MNTNLHVRAAKHHRDQAQVELLAAHLAAERDDPAGAEAHNDDHAFHLLVANHHETAAVRAQLVQIDAKATQGAVLSTTHP